MDVDLLIGIFPQVLLDGIILGFMYALIALGYTMVYGVLEFINFAHSEIFIVGAFAGGDILLGLRRLRRPQGGQSRRRRPRRARRLPAPALGPAAEPIHLRDRRIFLPPGRHSL